MPRAVIGMLVAISAMHRGVSDIPGAISERHSALVKHTVQLVTSII